MTTPGKHRILIVDDEEAILETMTYTFQDDYEVFTSIAPGPALELLEQNAPIAAVLSDQRMPNMTGVEFLTRVFDRHPNTVRIILTGFADMDAIIKAINDGHVYAYVTKPWEPDDLKQMVRRAVEHYELAVENERLLTELQRSNVVLESVMDRLDVGALAVDESGTVQAANKPGRELLGLEADPRGRPLKEVLGTEGRETLAAAALRVAWDEESSSDDIELSLGALSLRLRVAVHPLSDPSGHPLGRVIFFREISHEPLRRRFEELLGDLTRAEGSLRGPLETTLGELAGLGEGVRASRVTSAGMEDLGERISRTRTALENWLAVDDALAAEDYPDAQLLVDRMRVAVARWPNPDAVPDRVQELGRRVEAYYESGENPKQRTL